MKAQKFATVIIIVSLLFAAARADDEQAPEPSGTRYAQTSIAVISDVKIPVTPDSFFTLLMDDVRFSAGKKTLEQQGAGHINYDELLSTRTPLSEIRDIEGGMTFSVQLTVSLPEDCQPVAKEYLQACIEECKIKLHQKFKSEMRRFQYKYDQYIEAVGMAETGLAELQHQQNEIADGKPMDKNAVLQRQMEHRQTSIENNLQQTILQNRMREISEQISNIHNEVQIKIKNDEILRQLEQLLAQQEHEFEIIHKANETGQLAQNEVDQFREKLIRTKIELAQRKEQLKNEGSGEMLRELNRQLRETTTHLQELEIQQEVLAGTDPGSLSQSTDYEILEVKINAARENLHDAIMEKNAYERQINLIQPPIINYVDPITYSEQAPDTD